MGFAYGFRGLHSWRFFPGPVDMVNLFRYLQGFIHPRRCMISCINSICFGYSPRNIGENQGMFDLDVSNFVDSTSNSTRKEVAATYLL